MNGTTDYSLDDQRQTVAGEDRYICVTACWPFSALAPWLQQAEWRSHRQLSIP